MLKVFERGEWVGLVPGEFRAARGRPTARDLQRAKRVSDKRWKGRHDRYMHEAQMGRVQIVSVDRARGVITYGYAW